MAEKKKPKQKQQKAQSQAQTQQSSASNSASASSVADMVGLPLPPPPCSSALLRRASRKTQRSRLKRINRRFPSPTAVLSIWYARPVAH